MVDKSSIRKEFSRNWEKYYKLDFLVENGFRRNVCKKCGKGFWSLVEREFCPDQPCSDYEFIDNPVGERTDYISMWRKVEKFFVKNGHASIRRYPVIARWYPPLYFTDASIVDFYRIENGSVIFEFPANPLIIPQPCIRFTDLPNVGVTGRHYTSFVMIGQHSMYDGKNGYWKERCIELDYRMLTEVLKIPPEEIVFVEDAWVGTGAFGSSLEYFVRGLELGNAVFTEFLITPSGTKEMPYKVIDMGAGLERFCWLVNGSKTSYEAVFGDMVKKLREKVGVSLEEVPEGYWKIAGRLNVEEMRSDELREYLAKNLGMSLEGIREKIESVQALYAIVDHARTLALAITDGMIPSNVGGGYNLRVILRRCLDFIERFEWDLDLVEVCEMHAHHFKQIAPEIEEHLDEINEILEVERKRFVQSRKRAKRIVLKLKKEEIDEEKMRLLYESEGITPDFLKKFFPDIQIPPDFYSKITRKKPAEREEVVPFEVKDLPETQLLFYEKPYEYEFEAKVLKIVGNGVILDRTLFYPTGGGQACDKGLINDCKVVNVKKVGSVVIHELERIDFKEGDRVKGVVDKVRRERLRRHHTATHIINAVCREMLGSWIWQHSAFKEEDHARLDITHYEALSEEQVEEIEKRANEIVQKALPTTTKFMDRGEAEQKYGFRIYQGGAVPSKKIRIVEIEGLDVEACGGMHCRNTKEVGMILITRTKRIQDGVDRIEFCAGDVALEKLKEKEKILEEVCEQLGVSEEEVVGTAKKLFEEWKGKRKLLRKIRRKV